MEIVVALVDFMSPEYDRMVSLRTEVLRKPLGLEFTEEQLSGEYDSYHVGAFSEDDVALVGCMVLTPLENGDMKMRQVAVDPSIQGKGVGQRMVAFAEVFAARQDARRMVLHARDTAIPFYERLGYKIDKEPFTEVGIPHRFMSKDLRS